MKLNDTCQRLFEKFVISGDHGASDYFGLIKALLNQKRTDPEATAEAVALAYRFLEDEIRTNEGAPSTEISFGTSGWRGLLGKDVFVSSVQCVTRAIIRLYLAIETTPELTEHLGVASLGEAQKRGCLIGYDNRFGGELLAQSVAEIFCVNGFTVYFCGESTTGVLSAALLEMGAAFSVNLTPSHNPLEYGGYKYNAADAGPAASELTTLITAFAREDVRNPTEKKIVADACETSIMQIDSFALWQRFVEKGRSLHGIDYHKLLRTAAQHDSLALVIDTVHGAGRLHIERLLGLAASHLQLLRKEADVTFGGIAPEPSSVNMLQVTEVLQASGAALKIGAIIDPDGDRIRFTDGVTEISMNHFGAMAYHFLHERKGKRGMVAKTVATSNMANAVAEKLGEKVFETRVGFKEFKPVIGKALVCFEESDGISVIGHTPEKDAYIGLLLALDMVLTTGMNLGELKNELEREYGTFCPDRDGVAVSVQGKELKAAFSLLEKYREGTVVRVGDEDKVIREVIGIDGRKMLFEDGSWLMIRPSGTEPKVRFYVESKTSDGTSHLVAAAKKMLSEVGLLAG